VQLCLTPRAFEPEKEREVEQARMVDAVGIADECVGRAAQIEQTIPIGVVARQARNLQAEDYARAAASELCGHVSKAESFGKPRAGDAEVLVDDAHLIGAPLG